MPPRHSPALGRERGAAAERGVAPDAARVVERISASCSSWSGLGRERGAAAGEGRATPRWGGAGGRAQGEAQGGGAGRGRAGDEAGRRGSGGIVAPGGHGEPGARWARAEGGAAGRGWPRGGGRGGAMETRQGLGADGETVTVDSLLNGGKKFYCRGWRGWPPRRGVLILRNVPLIKVVNQPCSLMIRTLGEKTSYN